MHTQDKETPDGPLRKVEKPDIPISDRWAYSIAEICAMVGLSEAMFWKMLPVERPTTFRVGSRRIVSRTAAVAWIEKLEAAERGRVA